MRKAAGLLDFLNEHYSAGPFTISAELETSGQRQASLLEGPGGRFVVKLTYPGRPESVVRADVGTPEYLCAYGFPAPRTLPARDGQMYLPYGDRFVYLYEYIEGVYPRLETDFYRRLGELLARLHAIPPSPAIPQSEYVPERALVEARAALLKVDGFVGDPGDLSPEEQQAAIPELMEIIDRFPSFDGLPRGIIHTDPYFVNLIEAPGGELYLIDWEDGGISYPLMDVGYVLAHLCSFNPRDRKIWGVPGPEDGLVARPDWSNAFMEAYETIRPLTIEERRLLPDAARLAFLAYIVEPGTGKLILDNYRRMKLFDGSFV